MKARIYHNPRCSKSRATLALLESHGIDHEVVEYLQTPPSRSDLERLLGKLDVAVTEIVRFNEPEVRESGLDKSASRDELLRLIERHPKALERPIVEYGDRARIGRPPEQVLELFE